MRIAFIQFTIFFFAISLLFLFYLSYIQKISIDFNASKNKLQYLDTLVHKSNILCLPDLHNLFIPYAARVRIFWKSIVFISFLSIEIRLDKHD